MDKLGGWVKDSWKDTRDLIGSGYQGAKEAIPEGPAGPALAEAAQNAWKAAAIGAVIGVVGGIVSDDRKPGRGAVLGGLFGATVGLSAGIAWNARFVVGAVANAAMKNVNAARDAQWLAKNPVDYA